MPSLIYDKRKGTLSTLLFSNYSFTCDWKFIINDTNLNNNWTFLNKGDLIKLVLPFKTTLFHAGPSSLFCQIQERNGTIS